MEPLRQLRRLIAQVDFKSSNSTKQDHRAIYKHVVLSPESPIVKHVPPLEVILYSIQNILSPTLATRRIPDLLDLLATAEFYRGRTLDHARDAIIWNDYYQSGNRAITLTTEEEAFLKALESQKDSLRRVYMTVLTMCCRLDVYLLWTANPPSITNFFIRFNEYFPLLNQYCDNKSPRLFHADLSTEEREQLVEVGVSCCDLIDKTIDWAINHQGDNQSIQSAFQTQEFQNTFQRPCNDDGLSSLIRFFLGRIASAAKGVQDIFGGNEP